MPYIDGTYFLVADNAAVVEIVDLFWYKHNITPLLPSHLGPIAFLTTFTVQSFAFIVFSSVIYLPVLSDVVVIGRFYFLAAG